MMMVMMVIMMAVAGVIMVRTGVKEGAQEQLLMQEGGVIRSPELPQSMKIKEMVTPTATMSATKL